MLKNVLPDKIYLAITNVGFGDVTMIRLRCNAPVSVYIAKEKYFLNPASFSKKVLDSTIYCTSFDIKYILNQVSNNALYSINDDLLQGFVTVSGGVRIGVAGEIVSVDGVSKSVKNITSLCISIPHFIKNVSLPIFDYIVGSEGVRNTLIYSSPGAGKTTMLKDIIYQINHRCPSVNMVVIDTRRELYNHSETLDNVDYFVSSISTSSVSVIRSMRPDVVVLDEISASDYDVIEYLLTSGVSIIASIHAKSIADVRSKLRLLDSNTFDRYIELCTTSLPGQVTAVYDKDYSLIYL